MKNFNKTVAIPAVVRYGFLLPFFCFLIFLNIAAIHSTCLGFALLSVFLFLFSEGFYSISVNFFNFKPDWISRCLACFFSLIAVGSVGGFFVLADFLSAIGIGVVFFVVGLLDAILCFWVKRSGFKTPVLTKEKEENFNNSFTALISKYGLPLYLLLVIAGFVLLFISKSDQTLVSPWQTINPFYIFIFWMATLLIGLMIFFSSLKNKTLILLLILHSLLLRGYLPLTHIFPYGADQWRHLAAETQIVQESSLQVVLYDQAPASWAQKLNPGKFSYSNLWSLEVIFSRLFSVSLIGVNKWFSVCLWSLFLPLLLYKIAESFEWSGRGGLFLIWLSFLPFALQSEGSLTLPVSYGFLVWLFFVLLLSRGQKKPNRYQVVVLGVFLVASLFGYALYFILSLLSWTLLEALSRFKKSDFTRIGAVIFCGMIFLPLIEIFTRYSFINFRLPFVSQIKQLIGNFLGIYLAAGPRPHDISGGNIIFNQTPSYAFLPNLLTYWRWWVPVFMLAVIILSVLALAYLLKNKSLLYKWLATLSLSVFGSYVISFYFLDGQKILSRRLNIVLAFCFILLLFSGLDEYVFSRLKRPMNGVLCAVLLFSFAITASYSLGPDTKTLSGDEWRAVNYVWSNTNDIDGYCVLADTHPLLALEYFSAKKVVGGNFPIDGNFAQTERVELYNDMLEKPSESIWRKALEITKADTCWLVADSGDIVNNLYYIRNFDNIKKFGKISVWRYTDR